MRELAAVGLVIAVLLFAGAGVTSSGLEEFGDAMARAAESEARASVDIARIQSETAIDLANIRAELDTLALVVDAIRAERQRGDTLMAFLLAVAIAAASGVIWLLQRDRL